MAINKIIKNLGIFFILIGTIKLFSNINGVWMLLTVLSHPNSLSFEDYLLYGFIPLLFLFFLPLLIIIAGIEVFKKRKLGWQLAMAVCIITLIINVVGIINFAYAVYITSNIPMPSISNGSSVGIVSMWPTYVSALVNILLIFLLTRKSIKRPLWMSETLVP